MAIADLMKCPRMAFMKKEIQNGVNKAFILSRIASDVLLSNVDLDLNERVNAAFDNEPDLQMYSFEKEAERSRMTEILERYIGYEKAANSKIISTKFAHSVPVLGKDTLVHADRLIDRGPFVEAVRYRYKAPDLNMRGRTKNTMPKFNPDLLALQKCGQEEAKKQGINKPVYGAFYFLKAKGDGARTFAPVFDEGIGSNIVRHSFTSGEIAEMEEYYKEAEYDANCTTENSSVCYNCKGKDLCKSAFVKRSLVELPKVEETPLDLLSMTENQRMFVQFQKGECRVNAVAGSGKTAVVTLRTLKLIDEGCSPDEILMMTFTDKAKGEMQSRLRRYAAGNQLKDSNIDADSIVVETFNSFGQKLLDEHYEKLGFTSPPTLVDDVVKNDIIIKLLEAFPSLPLDYRNPLMNLPNAKGAVAEILRILDVMKANHVETREDAARLLGDAYAQSAAEILQLYNEYNKQILDRNYIDYEDQIRLMLQLKPFGVFKEFPYQHIVIDEFQDSDANQIKLILEMAKDIARLKSIVVVGDEMQSIYQFRNANPDNLIYFGEYFPDMIDISLEDNFRSQSPIIDMANRILQKEARISKVMRANKNDKAVSPVVRAVADDEEEIDLFVRQAKKLIRDGTAPRDIAVLCRTKAQLIKYQEAFAVADVPTILRVPELVGESPYVKAIIGLASFFSDHSRLLDLSVFRKSKGIDPYDTTELYKDAAELGKTYDSLSTDEERLALFTGMIEEATEDYVAANFVQSLYEKNNNDLNSILDYCVKYRDYGVRETISTAREDANAVTLITVHSAKGLEWPVVLLSLNKFVENDKEENRLLYVAVTRAMEKLLITYRKGKQNKLIGLLA